MLELLLINYQSLYYSKFSPKTFRKAENFIERITKFIQTMDQSNSLIGQKQVQVCNSIKILTKLDFDLTQFQLLLHEYDQVGEKGI